MSITAGDVRAELTLDTSKFSEGVARAQSELATLTQDGQRASHAFSEIEGQFTQSASAIAAAMQAAGQGSESLAQLAAKADAAQLKLESAANRATAAAGALSGAREAARQSGEALTLLKDSAAASAENLRLAKEELDALKQSGSATTAELTGAEQAVRAFSEEQAQLAQEIAQAEAAHAANEAAVTKSEAAYQRLSAQVLTSQSAADKAKSAFAALTQSLGGSSGTATLGRFGDQLSALGTSTLTSASRSLGSIAASLLGLQSGTVGSTLATQGFGSALKTLVPMLDSVKLGMIGAGASIAYQAYQYVHAAEEAKRGSVKWEKAWEAAEPEDTTLTALVSAKLELKTEGLASDVQSVYDEIAQALTDGEPDTPTIVAGLQQKTTQLFSDVRLKIQQWYDAEMALLDLSAPQGAQKAAELTATYGELLEKVGRLDASTAGWITEYAGQSTEACTAALSQLETYEEELERLAQRADELTALLNSKQRAAYTAVSNGLTSDETSVGNAVQYVVTEFSLEQGYAQDDYETQLAALWQEYQDKLVSASSEQEKLTLNAEYELKLTEANDDRQQQQTALQTEYRAQLASLLRGYASALAKNDPALREALDQAIAGNFESLDDLDLSNAALVNTFKTLVEAGALDGVAGADLSTTKGQMEAMARLLAQGTRESVDSAFSGFGMKQTGGTLGALLGLEEDDSAAALEKWALRVQSAADTADPETLRAALDGFREALDFENTGGNTGIEQIAKMFDALSAAADAGNLDASALEEYGAVISNVLTVLGKMDPSSSEEDLEFLTGLSDALNALGYTTDATTVVGALSDIRAQCEGLAEAAAQLSDAELWANFPKSAEEFLSGGQPFTWEGFANSAAWESAAEARVSVEIEPDWSGFPASAAEFEAGAVSEFSDAGTNAGGAFASGLQSQSSVAAAAGSALGQAAFRALKAALAIQSPSKKMREAGGFAGEGFALGISDKIVRAESSIQTLANRTLAAAGNTVTNNHYHGSPISVQASVRSDEDVRALANRLARLANGQNYGLR